MAEKPVPSWLGAAVAALLVVGTSGVTYLIGGMKTDGSVTVGTKLALKENPPGMVGSNGYAVMWAETDHKLYLSRDGAAKAEVGGGGGGTPTVVDEARTWTTTQTFAPAPADDGVLHTDPFYYSAQPVTLMSPEFDITQTDLVNTAQNWTVAISNNVMTIVTDPTHTTPHKLSVGQIVQFRNASTFAVAGSDFDTSSNNTWTPSWVVNTFLEGIDGTLAPWGNSVLDFVSNMTGLATGFGTFLGDVNDVTHPAHGFHPGDFVTIVNQDFYRDVRGRQSFEVLTVPAADKFTIRVEDENSEVNGATWYMFRCARVKSVLTPYSFTCDFTHADQAATTETGIGARIDNLGFVWRMPNDAVLDVSSIRLLVTSDGTAFGSGTITTSPKFNVGPVGARQWAPDLDSETNYDLWRAFAYDWEPFTPKWFGSYMADYASSVSVGMQSAAITNGVVYDLVGAPVREKDGRNILAPVATPGIQVQLNHVTYGVVLDFVKARWVITGTPMKVR
jgi:hypothetical protein